jgi:chemotaxis signal transduction protein
MIPSSCTITLIEFEFRGQRFGLPIDCVLRAIPSAEPAPLPGAGALALGMLNLGGKLIAVLDLGHRLGLPRVPVSPEQQILVIQLPALQCALVVDRIIGVGRHLLEGKVPQGLDAAPFADTMVRQEDGLCLVLDPARFLFPEEQGALTAALARGVDGLR